MVWTGLINVWSKLLLITSWNIKPLSQDHLQLGFWEFTKSGPTCTNPPNTSSRFACLCLCGEREWKKRKKTPTTHRPKTWGNGSLSSLSHHRLFNSSRIISLENGGWEAWLDASPHARSLQRRYSAPAGCHRARLWLREASGGTRHWEKPDVVETPVVRRGAAKKEKKKRVKIKTKQARI